MLGQVVKLTSLKGCQFIQVSERKVVIRYMTWDWARREQIDSVVDATRGLLGCDMQVVLDKQSSLVQRESGKIPFIISLSTAKTLGLAEC
jgi:hypothetical protein